MKGKEAWIIQLIAGILPRWANEIGRPTTNKKEVKIYNAENEAVEDLAAIRRNGFPWPFAEVKKITLRK
ncbi:hypothetical protein DMW20_12085 [Vibrio parahaemolyticus]|nr:hypothetical protein [Vibrio parahaemolyticus]